MGTTLERTTTSNDFSKGGNGKYKPLRKVGTTSSPVKDYGFDPFNPKYDRMSFKSTQDPVMLAFAHVEKQSPVKLTADLIKDGIKYISKMMKK